MPENPYRKGHLWSALAASSREAYSITRLRRLHPEWPNCPWCGLPVNPAALEGGYRGHPTCVD